MIRVIDLIKWAERMSVDRCGKVPNGYIRGQDLHDLAKLVRKKEPNKFKLEDLGDRF